MLPGFPNFFMVYGPNTNQPSGLQIVAMEEIATRFALENIGGPDLTVMVLQRSDRKPGGPAVFYIHGGGVTIGDRWFGTGTIIDRVDELDALLVTVEYRLAPEHPYPAPIDDCFAGLQWMWANQPDLGFDPDKLVIAGASSIWPRRRRNYPKR
jgi:acetyl esterase/lipase